MVSTGNCIKWRNFISFKTRSRCFLFFDKGMIIMELRVLKYFLMVAREQNITKAAKLLHVTQPTLSRQLMQLEDELNVKLFYRKQHNIELTDEGMLLRRRAQEIVSIEEKIKEDFTSDTENITGLITIGCGEAIGVKRLSKIVSDFSKSNPLVRFEIITADSDTIKSSLDRGTVDIGMLVEPVDITKYNFKKIIQKERWGVLTRNDSPLAKKAFVCPEDLLNYRLLMSNRAMVINEIEKWFGDYYLKLQIAARYNLGYNLVHFIKNKLGIAFCLESIDEMRDLTFIPLKPKLESGSVMVWKKDLLLSPAMKAFINYLKDYSMM